MVTFPHEWELAPLASLLSEPLSYGINAPAVPYNRSLPTYIRITDINEDGTYNDTDKASVISSEAYKYQLKNGDIVLARTGASTGKSYLYTDKDGALVFAGFLIKAAIDFKKHNPYYIFCQLHTRRYWDWVAMISMRSGQPGINSKEYGSLLIPVTDKTEQDRIAETLTFFDTHIANLTELIEKKKAIREGALEDLISGRTRIHGFSEKWVEYQISEITQTIITGGTPTTTRKEYYGGNIPWLSSTEIHQKLITTPTTYITDLGLQYSSAKIAPESSVLIALAGQGKTRGTAAYLTSAMALNQSLAALVANDKCNSEFLYYLIDSMYYPLREISSGDGGRGGLNKKLLANIIVTIPKDIAEQEAIATVLQTMDNEIHSLEIELDKIKQIREGAMDDLLTGKVRLKD